MENSVACPEVCAAASAGDGVEEWRKIDGYPDYSVSSKGRIRRDFSGRIRKPWPTRYGYMDTVLFRNGNRGRFRVGRLVASAFVPNPEGKPFVNHIDGNKKNNCSSNIEWCTGSENMKHAFKTGLAKSGDQHHSRLHPEKMARGDRHGTKTHPERMARGTRHYSKTRPELLLRGERIGNSVLSEDQVKEIRRLRSAGFKLRELSAMFGVDQSNISMIALRKTWSHVS